MQAAGEVVQWWCRGAEAEVVQRWCRGAEEQRSRVGVEFSRGDCAGGDIAGGDSARSVEQAQRC